MATTNTISASIAPISTQRHLRDLIFNNNGKILIAPGVYDGFTARIAQSVGFDAMYMTGAGTCASRLGAADLGLATQTDMVSHASMLANLDPSIPLIADADTGYGGPNMVARTVQAYHRAGVSALHIEDQIQTKRCGHLGGKELVGVAEFESRIRAAVQAREKIGSEIVIVARTDALQGSGFEDAVKRLKTAVAAGADVAFLEGLTSREEGRRICEVMHPTPVLLNMVENGATPTITPDEAQELGFRIIIFPFACIAPAYYAIRKGLEDLKEKGLTTTQKEFTPRKLFEVVGLEECMALDAAAGGKLLSGA